MNRLSSKTAWQTVNQAKGGRSMEKRVELGWLLDFYGPLLTEHRREILSAYCEEDLSLQEIAEQLGITRQGVYDALDKGEKQLMDYEAKLGLVRRSLSVSREAERCLELLENASAAPENLEAAKEALKNILRIER